MPSKLKNLLARGFASGCMEDEVVIAPVYAIEVDVTRNSNKSHTEFKSWIIILVPLACPRKSTSTSSRSPGATSIFVWFEEKGNRPPSLPIRIKGTPFESARLKILELEPIRTRKR